MILIPSLALQAVLAGAVSANQPETHVDYVDYNQEGVATKPAPYRTALNSSTDVSILAAPSTGFVREVTGVSIYNKDTASVTVTVKTDDGTTERIICKAVLLTLETLNFEKDRGWYVTTSTGAVKTGNDGISVTIIDAKGDLIAGTAADTAARLAVGSNGQALAADSSTSTGLVYIDNPSRPNLLVNPNWQIDQINEGALYTYSATTAVGPDGWSGTATGAGVFKLRTLADPDNAALKCLEITCTTADSSLASTDNYYIYTAIEGYDAAGLMAGTSSAQAITVQFKFKSNAVTGVFGVSIANGATNRSYVGSFTVSDTAEHEYSVTLTLDTSGTWLYTNGVGLYLRISLAAGSNFQKATGSWGADNMFGTSGNANFMSANTNVAYLKRIQLIPGSLVQAYKPADIQKELAKCQRQFVKSYGQGTAIGTATTAGSISIGQWPAGAAILCPLRFPVDIRAAPTLTGYSDATGTSGKWTDGAGADQTVTIDHIATTGARATISAGTLTAGRGHYTANARLS